MKLVATLAYFAGIAGLFAMNSRRGVRTSAAVWLPTIWLLLAGSRIPSAWFITDGPAIGEASQYLEGSPLERNIYLAILAVTAVVVGMRSQKVTRVLKSNLPVVAFIGYCAVSLAWSTYPDVGFKRWTKLVGDVFMALIVLTESDPMAAFDELLVRMGFILVPCSILLINYYPYLGRVYDNTGDNVSYTGVTTDKNALGMICMLIGLGFLWRFLGFWKDRKVNRQKGPLYASAIILLATLYLLFKADSATSKSCFFLCSGIIVLIRLFRGARKPGLVHTIAFGAVGLAVFALFFAGSLLESVGRNATLTGRTDLWDVVLSQPVNRLIGAGYESFWLGDRLANIWRVTGQRAVQSHNGYIELLVNLGWVGAGLFAAIVVRGYTNLVRNVRVEPEKSCLALAYLVAALIYNFTEAGFKMTYPVWIFFIWAVLSSTVREKKATVQAKPVRTAGVESKWYEAPAPQLWGQPKES